LARVAVVRQRRMAWVSMAKLATRVEVRMFVGGRKMGSRRVMPLRELM
jgi:hypothetical protein